MQFTVDQINENVGIWEKMKAEQAESTTTLLSTSDK